ncbi:sulfite exporter TauE/SafE family protein (plasmid) [Paenibacillus rhizovicinus]|uniref:Sulfite exporter TauE/SafE family protein n=1 Tax=Paenibacillus rhizovicinus TaxID=2704463 RepID=A0A6C0PA31_9BACL|nr:sulfite exporter TauE/SafE family protein [Paenibacillus rhizovicinus]QHW35408.1 sulfite exporter TauE/SafE family protein [Paenibacillus rhizovicinus]
MIGSEWFQAALLGIAGAPHCIVMCGGIGSSIAMQTRSDALRELLYFHAGRITTYALSGAILGALGSFLDAAGSLVRVQALASILGGILILLWAFRRYTLPLGGKSLDWHGMADKLIRRKPTVEWTASIAAGLLLGWLPCGLTYAMQMKAATTGSWVTGSTTMLIFGLATVPALVIVALTARRMSRKWRFTVRTIGYYMAVLMGVLSLMKGFSVNGWIPSIHPWLW